MKNVELDAYMLTLAYNLLTKYMLTLSYIYEV